VLGRMERKACPFQPIHQPGKKQQKAFENWLNHHREPVASFDNDSWRLGTRRDRFPYFQRLLIPLVGHEACAVVAVRF
jgi:hypothetical protein